MPQFSRQAWKTLREAKMDVKQGNRGRMRQGNQYIGQICIHIFSPIPKLNYKTT